MPTSPQTRTRIERLAWIFLYGGLLVFVLGLATLRESAGAGGTLMVFGGVAAVAGIVLIAVRSRL